MSKPQLTYHLPLHLLFTSPHSPSSNNLYKIPIAPMMTPHTHLCQTVCVCQERHQMKCFILAQLTPSLNIHLSTGRDSRTEHDRDDTSRLTGLVRSEVYVHSWGVPRWWHMAGVHKMYLKHRNVNNQYQYQMNTIPTCRMMYLTSVSPPIGKPESGGNTRGDPSPDQT